MTALSLCAGCWMPSPCKCPEVYSKNERAEEVCGLRGGGIAFDQPCELGYRCPVCDVYDVVREDGSYDERLLWSEYNNFLWCQVCNRDYPSALCAPNIERGIEVFLDSMEGQRRDASAD